ncbi:hypothetical protein [Anabaena sp. CCY 9910]|uniref:hypothetical protein n=1 Tax=Anabaena sp. CCY 9910 TaxID=3103870 RepID=UPI0039DFFD05
MKISAYPISSLDSATPDLYLFVGNIPAGGASNYQEYHEPEQNLLTSIIANW